MLKILAPAEGSPSTPGSEPNGLGRCARMAGATVPAALARIPSARGHPGEHHGATGQGDRHGCRCGSEDRHAVAGAERQRDAVSPPDPAAVATLIDQLASAAELTDPERLSTAVSRSGLWMEALLAQAALDPAQSSELKLDLKAQLLTLAQQIRVQAARPPACHPPPLSRRADIEPTRDSPAAPRRPGRCTDGGFRMPLLEPSQELGATPEASESRAAAVAPRNPGHPAKSGSEPPEETTAPSNTGQSTHRESGA
jgi:hypothetical protein